MKEDTPECLTFRVLGTKRNLPFNSFDFICHWLLEGVTKTSAGLNSFTMMLEARMVFCDECLGSCRYNLCSSLISFSNSDLAFTLQLGCRLKSQCLWKSILKIMLTLKHILLQGVVLFVTSLGWRLCIPDFERPCILGLLKDKKENRSVAEREAAL